MPASDDPTVAGGDAGYRLKFGVMFEEVGQDNP